MSAPRFTLCRAEFLLPLAAPDRGERIQDGYLLSEGETIREVGRYTPEVGARIRAASASLHRRPWSHSPTRFPPPPRCRATQPASPPRRR